MLDKLFATMFRLHQMARSAAGVFADLLLACSLANATCAITNIMTALIFTILIVSQSHAFLLVVVVRSSLHVLVAVAAMPCFQHTLLDHGGAQLQDDKGQRSGGSGSNLFWSVS